MKCSLCDKIAIGRGLCRAHYQQAWKDKTLEVYETKSEAKTIKGRLLEKCQQMPSGCWEWQAERLKRQCAYGMFWLNGKRQRAHRVSYEVHKGPIPEGIDVLHKCDNPPCINPDHLFLGTRAENCQDAASKDRFPLNEKHHNTKLSVDEVHAIRSSTLTRLELATQYGVNASTITRIKLGQRRAKA